MDNSIILTVIEFIASVIVEGIILAGVFAHISNKAGEQQQQHLQNEMNNIETQNKFIYEQLQRQIDLMKFEIISEIKEATEKSEN